MPQSGPASGLLELPTELVHHILTYLQPLDLAKTAATCQTLHTLCDDDRLWHAFVNHELPQPLQSPSPLSTFRALYTTHHPYWFLPRNRIWFSDGEPNGCLIFSRYDPVRGSIVANTVTAFRGTHTLEFWEREAEVIIHSFNPRVTLERQFPVLCLDPATRQSKSDEYSSDDRRHALPTRYSEEVPMPSLERDGLCASVMLCRALPESAITSQTQVWPPLRFPSQTRTRNDSTDNFSSRGHRPTSLEEISQETFRLHKWVVYNGRGGISAAIGTLASSLSTLQGLTGGLGFTTRPIPHLSNIGSSSRRFPESIMTFATLPASCYTPTKDKPWQGIWCGDYSGHGCEFLVVTQPDKEDEKPLPEGMGWLRPWLSNGRTESFSSGDSFATAYAEDVETANASSNQDDEFSASSDTQQMIPESAPVDHTTDYADVPSGRIEAIKLTGDPNIPRGEYTFIAPDIGHAGFVRVADEEPFRGARIVRSAGHIAGRGFREAQYTPSQLIMVSHDRVAQFWEGFGHISFYQRVDLDALSKL